MAREFRILGPLEVLDDGRALELGGPRQRAVLALLLLHAGQVIPAERLIEEIWAGGPPDGAAATLQSYISRLRRELGRETIVTRGGAYGVELASSEFDLQRFERLTSEATSLPPAQAAERVREAMALWRGPALAEFAYEDWAQAAIERLDELRLAATEKRIDADLELGRAPDVVAELTALVREHPLRERLHALLMLALYRTGRQADALDAYRRARETLVERIGIEPGPALRELEKAILRQAPELATASAPITAHPRALLVVANTEAAVLPLVSVAEPLARNPPRELIVVRLLDEGGDAAGATTSLAGLRDELVSRGLEMRVASYTSHKPADDITRLTSDSSVDLVLLEAAPELLEEGLPDSNLSAVLSEVVCDVAVLVRTTSLYRETARPVVVPFGGAEHDWSAVEIAAWTARALGARLVLLGTRAERLRGRRDASRLLGRASLVVQAAIGVVAEPRLVARGPDAIVEAASEATLLVLGLSSRWRREGLGRARLEVARAASVPTLLVRRGLRPGGLAPPETMTRFTWTLGGS